MSLLARSRRLRLTLQLPLRTFTTSLPRLQPTNPNPMTPSAEGDAAQIPRDKQGSDPRSTPGGHVGGPQAASERASGGPADQAGVPDPGIPKEEASKVKEGMTSGKNGPARN